MSVLSVRRWRQETLKKLMAHSGNACEYCNLPRPDFLNFYYKDELKSFNISTKSWSYDRLKDEIENCVLLCPKCYRKKVPSNVVKTNYMFLQIMGKEFDKSFSDLFDDSPDIIQSNNISLNGSTCRFPSDFGIESKLGIDYIEETLFYGNATKNILDSFSLSLCEGILATLLREISRNEEKIAKIKYTECYPDYPEQQFLYNHPQYGGNINMFRLYHPKEHIKHIETPGDPYQRMSVSINGIRGIVFNPFKIEILSGASNTPDEFIIDRIKTESGFHIELRKSGWDAIVQIPFIIRPIDFSTIKLVTD